MKQSFKILSILLCFVLFVTSFVACAKEDEEASTSKKNEMTTKEQTTEKSTLEVLTGDGLAKAENIDFDVLTTIDYYATDEGMEELLVGVWRDDFDGYLYDTVEMSASEYYDFTSDGYLYVYYSDVYIDYDQYIDYMVGVMYEEYSDYDIGLIEDEYGSLENLADELYWQDYESFTSDVITYTYSVEDGQLIMKDGYGYVDTYTLEFVDKNTVVIDSYEYTKQ